MRGRLGTFLMAGFFLSTWALAQGCPGGQVPHDLGELCLPQAP